ncbi:MAG TPA: glycoside hydrolase domain-containing protein, partial [Candidatus Acidoferrales bacterium]|nr:glycoside hydrolase domain-containing protein [Candidatus Acidoferrales bacterium]
MNAHRKATFPSRRLFAAAALLATAAFAAGCAQHGGSSALPTLSGADSARAGAAGTGGATVWTQTDAVKILPDDKPVAKNSAIVAGGAMGESVSYQLVVSATKGGLSNVNVAVSDLSDGHGHVLASAANVQLYREFYLDLTNKSGQFGHTGEYPDGLVPIGKDPYYHEQRNGAPFDVAGGKNQAVWIDFNVPANAAPGVYKGTAAVTVSGKPLAKVPVTFTVWNFALPATSSFPTAFGLNTYQAYLGHYGSKWNTDKIVTLSNLYQAEALKHRISLYENDVETPQYTYNAQSHKITHVDYSLFDATYVPNLNGTLLKNGAQATTAEMPDDNATAPGATPGPQDAEALAYWKLMGGYFNGKGWLGRNFYYDVDEPQTSQDFATAVHRADLVHQADPSIRVMETTTIHKELIGKIDIWDPNVTEFDNTYFPPPSAYAARQKAGDKVWFYHSNSSLSSGGPWPNFFVDASMNDARILGWLAWRYKLDGFLYYATTLNYNRTSNPWTNVWNFGDNGDGVLFYPGKTSLIGGRHDIPCDSI